MSDENKPVRGYRPYGGPSRIGRIGDWSGTGSSNPGSSGRPAGSGPRFGTLGSMGSSGRGDAPQGRGPSNSDSDDEERQTFFAGGERSGVSIEGPRRGGDHNSMLDDIIRRARPGQAPEAAPESGARSFFGSGNVLGSTVDNIPSQSIPDPTGGSDEPAGPARRLILWADGFSIDDGPLYRYDDPNNRGYLEQIRSGVAPQELMNIAPNEEASVTLERRQGEEYASVQRAFGGSGNRLGNPVPGVVTSTSPNMPGGFSDAPVASSSSAETPTEGERGNVATKFEVDHTQPTTSITVRLADGTRLVVRMNLTHTVLDLRNFINASRPGNLTRPYTIATTFPTKLLEDNSATIESAGLANSVVVQKWT